MVNVSFSDDFKKEMSKIKDEMTKEKIRKQIEKIIRDPLSGKPMRNVRRGTRELRITPYRLAYTYIEKADEIVILDFYHKDEQ